MGTSAARSRVKLTLDHHYSPIIAELLRTSGHDVVAAMEQRWGREDDEPLLALCVEDGRTLLTNNVRDYVIIARSWSADGRSQRGLIFTSDAACPGTETPSAATWRRSTRSCVCTLATMPSGTGCSGCSRRMVTYRPAGPQSLGFLVGPPTGEVGFARVRVTRCLRFAHSPRCSEKPPRWPMFLVSLFSTFHLGPLIEEGGGEGPHETRLSSNKRQEINDG